MDYNMNNTTVNNTNAKENNAMNNTEVMSNKTQGQYIVSYQQNGYGGCIPTINGEPHQELMFGYATPSDRDACLRLIGEALRECNGDIHKAQMYMYNACLTAANEIKPDEAVALDGNEVLISYRDKKAYLGITEIANMEDLPTVEQPEAVKALLVERAKAAIAEMATESEEWEEYDLTLEE